ncbi:MAG: phosphohistidine swiveling domain-containing protein [Candidatus Poriferisodalaceae bacterium]
MWAERTPGMTAADIDAGYFGDHPDVPDYVAEPWHENAATTEVMTNYLGWVMGSMDQSELEEQRVLARQIRAARPDLQTTSDADLLARAKGLRSTCRSMFDMHINQSGAASIGPGVIGAVCAAVGRPEAAMRILAGLGGVDSASPSYAMWELSRSVRSSPQLMSAFEGGTQRLAERLRADLTAADFVASLDEFVGEDGSRGPNEWDIHADTWETTPDLVLAMVDRMRLQPDDESPLLSNAAREAERETLTAEIAALVEGDPETHGQFIAGVAPARTFVPGRERSKTNIIQETRMAVWEIGRCAVERGELGRPQDICMLFEDELVSLAAGELADVSDVVTQRQRHYDHLLTLELPFIINGEAPPSSEWEITADRQFTQVAEGEVIQGMPGCAGTYRGTARVVLDPSDPLALQPGDVLIATHTDPAWTPLFVPAGGVVVDVGAALSHAIIVSRKLGIPCVVSATDATSRIPDGAIIEVNGDAGTVTVIELP